jgi:flavin-dependent dehydrogenase
MPSAHRVVVVGAGPAGSTCALELARTGAFEVQMLDKSQYPRVKVCGSGLSPSSLALLARLGLADQFAPRAAHMSKLLARGPDGGEVLVDGGHSAWVVPRLEFDYGLVRAAVDAGATMRESIKVTELLRDADGDVRGVRTDAGDIEADIVVCATGSPSRLSTDDSDAYAIRTIMGWWRGTSMPQDQGIMSWDRRLEGYYAWAFPEPDGVTNIGITIPENAAPAGRLKPLFDEILDDQFGDILRGAERVGKWMGHPAVVTTRVSDRIAEPRALWIGEAARFVSPGTVEGISFAMESGILAADTIAHHFDPARGLSRTGRTLYRVRVAAHMLPKFWAGEGLVKLMRSDRARYWATHAPGTQWLASKAARVVGHAPS